MSTNPVRDYLDARNRVDQLKEELEKAKAECDAAELAGLDHFAREGVQNMKMDGRTIYLSRDLRASVRAGQLDGVIAALRAHGYEDLVKPTVNAQSLSALVREIVADDSPLPADLAECVNVAELFSLRVRGR